ncbi:MAG: mRNA interferase MazF [Candidatus Kentron sp. G]|nr:MAG: mRNA interferase MazF [Candidatus Kentron sp. G]VFN07090.1 MAG: mRNA interferase MazF [Candidatus Kentron sp. G]VFN07785.1 MAG: mRNA interferase MazF [Candidatus Kentron sp. G]
MKQAGKVILFRFPQTDMVKGKLRPAMLLGELPGNYNDWLICMISSRTGQYVPRFDEIVREDDDDCLESGLKSVSVIRRVAGVERPWARAPSK